MTSDGTWKAYALPVAASRTCRAASAPLLPDGLSHRLSMLRTHRRASPGHERQLDHGVGIDRLAPWPARQQYVRYRDAGLNGWRLSRWESEALSFNSSLPGYFELQANELAELMRRRRLMALNYQ